MCSRVCASAVCLCICAYATIPLYESERLCLYPATAFVLLHRLPMSMCLLPYVFVFCVEAKNINVHYWLAYNTYRTETGSRALYCVEHFMCYQAAVSRQRLHRVGSYRHIAAFCLILFCSFNFSALTSKCQHRIFPIVSKLSILFQIFSNCSVWHEILVTNNGKRK